MKWVILLVVGLLVGAGGVLGQPVQEIWRLQINNGQRLGPHWTDPDSPTEIIVAAGGQLVKVINGEITQTSPNLNGDINSIITVIDPEQGRLLIAGIEEAEEGVLTFISADSLELRERRNLGASFDLREVNYNTYDGRNISSINAPTDWGVDTLKSLIIGQKEKVELANGMGNFNQGSVFLYSVAEDEFLASKNLGAIIQTRITRSLLDTTTLYVGSELSSSEYQRGLGYIYTVSCRIDVLSAGLDSIHSAILAQGHFWDYENPVVAHFQGARLLGVNNGGAIRLYFYVCFEDSAGSHLSRFDTDLNFRRDILLPCRHPIKAMYNIGTMEPNLQQMMLISATGELVAVDLNRFRVTGYIANQFPGYIDSDIGGFGGDGQELLVLTGDDLTLYQINSLSIDKSDFILHPSSLILSSFPNPFNSSATISYSLPRPGRYAVDVVDISGRLVARLSDGWKEAGSYREIWDGNPMASGQYVLRVNGVAGAVSRPVTIIK